MKKFSFLVALVAMVSVSFAQLPDGSYGQNFHLFEINKTTGSLITSDTISLYNYTDAGKAVVMDVSATWCSPCWSYHSSGALETLYSEHSDEVQVLFVEGSYGNYASLSGTGVDDNGSATQGNWLSGVEYPVIPLHMGENYNSYNSFHTNYAIGYFPTVYLICPNRLVYEIGQKTAAQLYAGVSQMCPQYDGSLMNNGLIVECSGINPVYYCSASFAPTIKLQNVGDLNITSAEFNIECNGQTNTYSWTGSISKFELATITLPQITITDNGTQTYTVTLNTVNGVADADPVMNTISKSFNVQVNGVSANINEDFTSGIPDDWTDENEYLSYYSADASHGNAVYFNCYNYNSGVTDNLYLPMLNLTNLNTPTMKFDLAHKNYGSYSDRLKVQYSTNCGSTWTTAYNKAGSALATAGSSSSVYIPSAASEWRTETVDLSAAVPAENVIIRFNFTSGYGNVIWIDNVQLVDGTGVVDFEGNSKVYPNPASNVLNISSSEKVEQAEIFNLQGQMVMVENGNVQSMNISGLAAGSYIVRIHTVNGEVVNHRFVKE